MSQLSKDSEKIVSSDDLTLEPTLFLLNSNQFNNFKTLDFDIEKS